METRLALIVDQQRAGGSVAHRRRLWCWLVSSHTKEVTIPLTEGDDGGAPALLSPTPLRALQQGRPFRARSSSLLARRLG